MVEQMRGTQRRLLLVREQRLHGPTDGRIDAEYATTTTSRRTHCLSGRANTRIIARSIKEVTLVFDTLRKNCFELNSMIALNEEKYDIKIKCTQRRRDK
ncbi:hypothetical protein PUN28_015906 [Cardiocondyla obscurior]|uniref:Uncharacterized protein n=1 Tax=Cardiocondyla obscurior TaxID=286306 RepID=A0AAW2ETU1_9HYME